MNDDLDSRSLHPHIALLLRQYARDLAQIAPSSDLDARIDALVAGPSRKESGAARPSRGYWPYAVAAGLATLAIGLGIYIGMKFEQSRALMAETSNEGPAHEVAWSSADLTMWPSDSVSFQIPAEFSSQGKLVAVDPDSRNISTRYWIDVVVSNDGTFRIERVVPADARQGGQDDVAPKIQ